MDKCSDNGPARAAGGARRAFCFAAGWAALVVLAPSPARCQERPVGSSQPQALGVELLELDHGRKAVALTGLSKEQQQACAAWEPGDARWNSLLSVHVSQGEADDKTPAMLGSYRLEGGRALFIPRFPLRAGLAYSVRYDLGALAPHQADAPRPVVVNIEVPSSTPAPRARLERIYPSGDVLPENQLKFYFHFSAPMSRGGVYRHVRLFKQSGEEIEMPFLELEQELWDPAGKRFTLFFDPGRIKRGLKPREEVGPALEEGESYTLLVSGDWHDAFGRPLASEVRKSFRVVAPDDVQPNVDRWMLTAPPAGGRAPLELVFDEPLDHAMLQRVIGVRRAGGQPVVGAVQIDRDETRWRFTPGDAWQAGQHEIVVHNTLEDRAGNSLGRPFEVDIFDQVDRSIKVETVTLPFEVRSGD